MIFSSLPDTAQLITIIGISVFMAISPGPDFFMITRNSIVFNKTAGIYSAIGVSVAIWLHIAYSIAGLAVVISKSILLFSIIKYAGAAYLVYIGLKSVLSKGQIEIESESRLKSNVLNRFSAFRNGFVTNALNPKTTIFFLSIFTQVIDGQTPLEIQLVYGGIISITHFLWFSLVATVFSHPILLKSFNKYKKQIEKTVGIALIAFGLKVALTTTE